MAASPNKQTGFISAKEPPPTVMNDTTDGSTKVTNEKVIAKKHAVTSRIMEEQRPSLIT